MRGEALHAIVAMLAPIVPHMTHTLWAALGGAGAVIDAPWPAIDESALASDSLALVVQVNGRLRGRIEVAVDAQGDAIERAALANADVARFVGDQPVKRVIVVPGKLVNVVV